MKFYTLNTIFTFGIFEGKSLKDVIEIQPSYIEWCCQNLNHFFIGNDIIAEIQSIKPDFFLTKSSKDALEAKYNTWLKDQDEDDDYEERESTYEKYSGTYAQDIEGWSDQDIDDAFDGEPDAYWNID